LFLSRDVGVVDIAKSVGGLVVAIDGLNEHPGREDLIHRICSLAQGSLTSVDSVRFAVTWRTDDDRWISEALGRSRLWWSPEEPGGADGDDVAQGDVPGVGPSDSHGGRKSRAKAEGEASQSDDSAAGFGDRESAIGLGPSIDGASPAGQGEPHVDPASAMRPGLAQRKDERPRDPFVRIGPLTAQECSEAWRRYREAPDLRLNPAFDWRDVQHRSPELARQLTNPLWMRMLMECYHERPLPGELGETDVFAEYLERIRHDYRSNRASELLMSLGKLMLRKQTIRVTLEDLEAECWDLVHPREGLSALPALERRGVLSSIDGRSYTFAVERLAEQVIGEHIASTEDAESGRSLAALAVMLVESRFAQAHGAVQVALHQRMRSADPAAAEAYLFDFIDHCPPRHAVLAASVLERRIEDVGDSAAAALVEQLLEDPTPSDLVAACGAARRLVARGLEDLAFAFLTPFVTPERLSLETHSFHYRELLVEYVACIEERLSVEAEEQVFWFDCDRVVMALEALRSGGQFAASVEADRLLGLALVSASSTRFSELLGTGPEQLLEEAVEVGRRRLKAAAASSDPAVEDDARHNLSNGLRLLAERRGDSAADQEGLLIEALNVGQRVRNPDAWNAAAVLWDLACVYERRKDFERALQYLRECASVERRQEKWWPACQTESRISDVLQELGRHEEALRAQARAVDFAKASGSPRHHAVAEEWMGDTLRRAGRLDEAMEAYHRSLHTGMGPPRAGDWSPNSVLSEIANVHMRRGDVAKAIEILRRAVETARHGGDRRELAIALEQLGHALHEAGRYREAIDEYAESHEVGSYPEPVERWRQEISLHWQARCHQRLGEHDRAIEIRRSLVERERQSDDRRRLCIELDWLACALRDAGRFDDAAVVFGDAYEAGMVPEQIPGWTPSGILYRHSSMCVDRGEHDSAIRLCRHAESISRHSGDRAQHARDMENLGDVLRGARRFEEALSAYRESFAVGMHPEPAAEWSPRSVLNEEAETLSSIGDYAGCLAVRQRAVELCRRQGQRQELAFDLESLGDALQECGRLEEAADSFAESFRCGMHPDRVPDWNPCIPLGKEAGIRLELGEEAAAADLRRQAVELRRKDVEHCRASDNRKNLANALEYLGDALREAGSAEDALTAYRESFDVGMLPERAPGWSPRSVQIEEARLLASVADHEGCILVRRRLVAFSREDGDRRNLTIDLEHLGHALRDAGLPDDAIEMYQESHRVGMDPSPVQNWNPGISLGCQASLIADRGDKPEALRLRREIVALSRSRQIPRELAIALEHFGDALREAGSAEEALFAYRESFEVGMSPVRAPDWSPESVLREEADLLSSLGDHEGCVSARRRVVEFAREDGDRRGLAVGLEFLGHALRDAGRPDEAIGVYQESHRVGMDPSPVQNWNPGISLRCQAELMEDRGEKAEALRLRHEIVEIERGRQDRRELAIGLEFLGHALRDAGRPDEAIEMYQESHRVGMNPSPVEKWNPGISLRHQAELIAERGDKAEALRLRREVVAMSRARQIPRELAIALEFLGDALREAGSAEEALSAYRESFEVGMSPTRAPDWSPRSVLREEAALLSSLGDHEGCVSVRRRVVGFAREDGDRRALAVDLEFLGHALRAVGRPDEAIGMYQESHRVGMDPSPVQNWNPGISLRCQAELMEDGGEKVEALRLRHEVVEIARGRQDRRELAIALEALGDALRESGQPGDAAIAFAEAFDCGMYPEVVEEWSPRIPTRKEAGVREALGEQLAAGELRRRVVELSRAEVERCRGSGDRGRHADCLEYLGDALREAGSDAEALATYRESYDVGMRPERVQGWSPRSVMSEEAKLLASLGDGEGCVSVRRRIVEVSGQDGQRRDLTLDLDYLGDALLRIGRHREAVAVFAESFREGMHPERIPSWNPCSSLVKGAEACLALDDQEGADELYRRAVELRRADVERCRRSGDRGELANHLEYLGDALRVSGKSDEALSAYRESYAVGMQPERAAKWSPRSALAEEAALLSTLGDHAGAAVVRLRAIDFIRLEGDRRALAIEMELLGDDLRLSDRSEEAIRAYLESFEAGTTPPVRFGGDAARPLLEVALMVGAAGDNDGAIRYLRRAVELARGPDAARVPNEPVVLLRASGALGARLSSAGMVIAALEEMHPDRQAALALARGTEGSDELLLATANWWRTQAECLEAIGDRHEAESARRRERRTRSRLTEQG
jgi:tetratricopeptide (TPR) repeat protein